MKRSSIFSCSKCVLQRFAAGNEQRSRRAGTNGFCFAFAVSVVALWLFSSPVASAQIQSTITCPPGRGYWDVLSVMMMDPGLAADYHMEGITNGLPSAYVYTIWDQAQNKVFYVKNPQGNPWDVNLYDSSNVYQWVTELQQWNGVNHWNDPASCKKFNNGSQLNQADFSMRWAARCAVPGGANSTMWNAATAQPNNTNYYTYVNQVQQYSSQNLGYSLVHLGGIGSMQITDHRANPPQKFSVATLPLNYYYSCSAKENLRSCQSLEIFEYGFDATVNPVDKLKHSYGWIGWRLYANATGGNPTAPAKWVLKNTSVSDHLMAGQVNPNFQCF